MGDIATSIMSSILSLNRLRQEGHRECLACIHPDLHLDFSLVGSERLHSSVDFTLSMCSFNGHVHGGLLAFIIDEAVTCLLMSEGKYAVTGELNLRYKHPVKVDPTAHIEVWLERSCGRLSKVKASLKQQGKACVEASARMMEEKLQKNKGVRFAG
jgi:acyl-coenzyme A thioesterase PaaI-like protein